MVENVSPVAVYEALKSDKSARLVDVRTDAEWAFVGLPDLSETGQDPVLIPWQVFPTMQVNGGFVDHLRKAGLTPEHKVYFLCRSGVRSVAAAQAAAAGGFGQVFNIADGFEGPPDEDGH
ncbi:MAG: rhodanese-like domain-containing protein, partial [Janthinobacterium lividum]